MNGQVTFAKLLALDFHFPRVTWTNSGSEVIIS